MLMKRSIQSFDFQKRIGAECNNAYEKKGLIRGINAESLIQSIAHKRAADSPDPRPCGSEAETCGSDVSWVHFSCVWVNNRERCIHRKL